jgi:putative NADPH-quinone reductase
MKRLLLLIIALLSAITVADCKTKDHSTMNQDNTEKILFVNGSPRVNGNTAALAKTLLEGRDYETLMLTDYRINAYGQTLDGDQFDEVVDKMKEADIVVMGSPVYWHNICASMRTLMERFYGTIDEGAFSGKKLFFLYQGAAPTQMMIDDGEYTMSRFARMYGFEYMGMANSSGEARSLRAKLGD